MSSVKNVILQGEKITRIFHQEKTETKVLDGVDIKIFEKDFTVIMGPSGAGNLRFCICSAAWIT